MGIALAFVIGFYLGATAIALCVMTGNMSSRSGETSNRHSIPRPDILEQCRHFAQFRCCDTCPNGYGGPLDECPIVSDWKAAVIPAEGHTSHLQPSASAEGLR